MNWQANCGTTATGIMPYKDVERAPEITGEVVVMDIAGTSNTTSASAISLTSSPIFVRMQ